MARLYRSAERCTRGGAAYQPAAITRPDRLSRQLATNDRGALGERTQLLYRHPARQLLHPAIGGQRDPLGLDVREHLADPLGDLLGMLDLEHADIDHADVDA